MSALSDIVFAQTTMGPHTVTLPEIGFLLVFLFVLIMLFPYLQQLPLIYKQKVHR